MEQDRPAIVGLVTRADARPVPRATLTLTDLQGHQLERAWTDTNGAYSLLPPTGGSYIVICLADGHQPRAALVAVAGDTVRHDVELLGASGISGTVRLGGTSRGVAGVTVTLLDLYGTVVGATPTGPDGTYAFDNLTEGTYTLTAASANHQPVATTVTVPARAPASKDIEIAGRARLTGAVVSASTGKPVEEALVTLIDATGTVVAAGGTGPDGAYAFDDLSEGSYTLTAAGYAPVATEVSLTAGERTDADIALKPPRAHV